MSSLLLVALKLRRVPVGLILALVLDKRLIQSVSSDSVIDTVATVFDCYHS